MGHVGSLREFSVTKGKSHRFQRPVVLSGRDAAVNSPELGDNGKLIL